MKRARHEHTEGMSTDWTQLSRTEIRELAIGRVSNELARFGWSVRRPADSRSNRLEASRRGGRLEIQVRVVRKLNYTFIRKRDIDLTDETLVAYVRLPDSSPLELYLIPSRAWESPDALLPSRDFGAGMSSPPEFGIQVAVSRLDELERRFGWGRTADRLLA
jgi:hypothetical protein